MRLRIVATVALLAVLAGCSAGSSGSGVLPSTQSHSVQVKDNGGGPPTVVPPGG